MRNLTDIQKQFVKEAEEYYFSVQFDQDNGYPFAVGAINNGNCFSMDVSETVEEDGESSVYTLKSN